MPEVILDEPDALRQLHREFLRAGSDVMVALTYYAHREKLKDVGRDGDLEADEPPGGPDRQRDRRRGRRARGRQHLQHLVLRPRGPGRVGRRRPRAVRGAARLGRRGGRRLRDRRDQRLRRRGADRPRGLPGARAAGDGHVRERAADERPTTATTTSRRAAILADAGAAVVGLNCSRGPGDDAAAAGARSARRSTSPVAAQPVPYRTTPATPAFESLRSADGRHLFPIAARAVPVHALRDGGLRPPRPRHRRRLHRHLLRRRARTTCARWPRRWAARRRPAGTRPPSSSIPSSGRPAARPRSWAAGAPAADRRARPGGSPAGRLADLEAYDGRWTTLDGRRVSLTCRARRSPPRPGP